MSGACGLLRFGAVLALFCASLSLRAAEPPLPPKPDKYFNDYAHVVAPDVAQRLNGKLEQFERDTSNQVLVAIFPRLPEGTYLEDYTIKTFQSWGPGGRRQDNGLVLFVFIADRKMRIEVGYGLEGAVPDSIAAAIIRNEIRPPFKQGNYAAGLEAGVEAIFKAAKHEYKGTGATLADGSSSRPAGISQTGVLLLLGLVMVFFIWCQMGDTMIQRGGRTFFWGLFDILRLMILTSGSGRGGGSGWGGGGGNDSGGSFRGGGGSGGGGGASGDW